MEIIFKEELLRELWASGKPYDYGTRREYRTGKMSYGTFFLEPWDEDFPQGRAETEPFQMGTIFLKRTPKDEWEIDDLKTITL